MANSRWQIAVRNRLSAIGYPPTHRRSFMHKPTLFKLLVTLVAASLVLAACGGGAAPTAAPLTLGSGFVCPQPQSKSEVTSKEFNLFVWTEYIPPDIIDCFELIYGVTVNHDEYSANEEMYAKLSAGSANYDLVQPTDYIVSLMIRQGLLQKLDKSKLTIMGNFDPNYLNFSFDPGNEYTLPYQAGTDALVVNTDAVPNP